MTKKAAIYYIRLPNCESKGQKLEFLANSRFEYLAFDRVLPDAQANWINQTDNDYESLLAVCDKQVKLNKSQQAVFRLFSLGVVTNRDDWVFDFYKDSLINKIDFLIETYNNQIDNDFNHTIKWTRAVKKDFAKGIKYKLEKTFIINCLYRPFTNKKLYFSQQLNEMQYQLPSIFGKRAELNNKVILFSTGKRDNFLALASNKIPSLDIFMPNATQCLPLYSYDKDGNRHDNITDWALKQFNEQYRSGSALSTATPELIITKLDIFHYIYAVLHNPAYREKYEINLKREFPRIPFYNDFEKWAAIGKQLMDLHLHYETDTPYLLQRQEINALKNPKVKLKANKINGSIILDDNTQLNGIPASAWEYKLGNRSALEWVLDQYREKKPKDKTIAQQFNTYRFADYKEQVIDLLSRVCSVCVETVQLIKTLSTLI